MTVRLALAAGAVMLLALGCGTRLIEPEQTATPPARSLVPVATLTPTPPPATAYAGGPIVPLATLTGTATLAFLADPAAAVTPPLGTPLDDADTVLLLDLLLQRPLPVADVMVLLDRAIAQRDVRFIAPLIEVIRAGSLHLADFDDRYIDALRALAGVDFRRDWDRWVQWYGNTELVAPPGFAGWKGRIYAGIDPRFTTFLRDSAASTIRVELIAWGNVPVDGIRALDHSPTVAADSPAAAYLDDDEPVFGLVVNGEARAYPLRIMDAHEMANDTLGGVPITLAYCTLCGSAIAYDARGPDGVTYTFSSSGLLYESNKLMYDHQTETLWNQFTGRPVMGSLVEPIPPGQGPWLRLFPSVTARWADWRSDHPDTTVLALDTGFGSGYTLGFPYLQYFASGDLEYPVTERDLALNAKTWVYGLIVDGVARAYPLREVARADLLHDEIAGTPIILVAPAPALLVTVEQPRLGELSYTAGAAIRAYARPPGVIFAVASEDGLTDAEGQTWDVTEDALISPDGQVAPRITGRLAYWFAWRTFNPETEVFGAR